MADKKKLIFVTDARGWVQERRLGYLKRFLPEINFYPMSAARFAILWNSGKLKENYIYFATWRIPSGLAKTGLCVFTDDSFNRFMTSVTSHYSVGGGLNPAEAVAKGLDIQEAYDSACSWLSRFRVVTVNSRVLYNLLAPSGVNLIYAPNGLDTVLFSSNRDQEYNPDRIRIGWVGKQKAAKNYPVIDTAFEKLSKNGFEVKVLSVDRSGCSADSLIGKITALSKRLRPPEFLIGMSEFADRLFNSFQRPVSYEDMPQFYHGIDYYLCASWHEGTPNPALEAASCGVPVVTTRVGNMPDLIEDGVNGFFVDPDVKSIMEVFSRIKKLDVSEYSRMSGGIRQSVVSDWTWDKNIESYRKAFNELLG